MNVDESTLSRTDRDMLVSLNTKVDQLTMDVKDIKDGTTTRLARAEARLDAMDIYHARIPLSRFEEDAKWVEEFRANWKLSIGFFMVVLGMASAVLVNLISHWMKLI